MNRLEELKALKEVVEEGPRDKLNFVMASFDWPGDPWPDDWSSKMDSAFLGSLDAVRDLHEALFRDRPIEIKKGVKAWIVHIPRTEPPNKVDRGRSTSLSQAWLLAILSALIAQEEDQ